MAVNRSPDAAERNQGYGSAKAQKIVVNNYNLFKI
jgi:hypothetical protein